MSLTVYEERISASEVTRSIAGEILAGCPVLEQAPLKHIMADMREKFSDARPLLCCKADPIFQLVWIRVSECTIGVKVACSISLTSCS